MQIALEIKGRTLVVRLEGELDHHTAATLRTAIERELDRDVVGAVLLNLAALTFMDSSGLGVILGRYRRLSQDGGRLAACCLSPQVERIFQLSGLTRIIGVFENEQLALQHL